ncbi:hypothetical protein ACJJIQ_02005 [Microbulbifer sp. ANSA003]|uniref:hypothetical protein n=1 Tax=Microbulbifer sp. ANSA003 TaxID=3243360 RepID=UPI0040417958
MYEETITKLEELAKTNADASKSIGEAIALLKFCQKHNISRKDNVVELPETEEAFGFFAVKECDENGKVLRSIDDEQSNPVEIISQSIIIERKS